MVAGKLNEVITVVKSVNSKDSYGATTISWEDSYTTKASVVQNNGSRVVVNNEIFNSYTVEFVIRYYHLISEKDRIKWNNNLYQIESIIKDRRKNNKTIITTLVNE